MNTRDYGKKLNEVLMASRAKIDVIQKAHDDIKNIKVQIEEYLKQTTELNNKITDEGTGLQAILESAQELEGNISASKASADAQLQKITESLNNVRSSIEEMETAYTEFTELNNKITDEETGLQAILDQATKLKSDIVAVKSNAETVYKEIRIFRDNAAEYIKEIENFKGNADNTTQKIQNKYDESAELEKKIQEIFDIGTKGAHANYFVERRNQIMLVFIAWGVVSLLCLAATVFLAVHFIAPMADKMKHSLDVNLSALLLRFSILTPTTFAFIYSLNQYSQERRLYEKYAFKAISTYSIETSLNTLLRSTKGLSDQSRDKKITDFAICTFNSIYQEPIETKKERWSFGVGNKILKLTAETNQTVGKIHQEVDNLKDLAKQEMGE